ncbi:hypothetical protein ACQEUU_14270 [Nonomuraea sp. CA-218870]|uniref:hypothetical protein n=1 Tax=Nonomuraea sp. CA-218870 TaxID=3239998 RepID=UPI003D8CAC98
MQQTTERHAGVRRAFRKRELGRVVAELLLDEARPGHRHQKLVYRPRLVVRESTAPPRR